VGAALVGVVWANSPWGTRYEAVWGTPVVTVFGRRTASLSLGSVVNDVLMTLFFLVVGSEIRQEFREGSLSDFRRASLPVVAAVGGMIVPALIYLVCNQGHATKGGWGIPTATDIALSVGVLSLLGRSVPAPLRTFLLAIATVDDIGSVVVVSIFYPSGGTTTGLFVAASGAIACLALRDAGARKLLAYAVPCLMMWVGLSRAGIEPALSGIPMGLLVPLESTGRLHPWVAYGIAPLFVLANAGLAVNHLRWRDKDSVAVLAGIVLARVLGKPIGIVSACYAAVGTGACRLPTGVTWRGVLVIGCLGGIGLTVPIYIARSGFANSPLLTSAKLALLVSGAASALVGILLGKMLLTEESLERENGAN